ncbi:hypothetical protein FIV00_10905 [Labrenzia sp. THAF82]|uniref:hypothetical protein n=1 Tax=Labrenzia sp. THAF82 TaxID=2587861 RepID=UPI001268B489|nr:hypothetical protein [Labrenzia sp. THAF82]QFT30987.1 hypothetical protein FIV00_10905 [Labrenzia sp. THAF82]
MTDLKWEWIPGIGVGPMKFGAPIKNFIERFELKLHVPEGTTPEEWGSFIIQDFVKSVTTEHGLIQTVECEDYFGFRGKNLIGMSEEELIAHMGSDPDKIGVGVLYENGSVQTPFDYDALGLIVWFEDEKLISAAAMEIIDD